MKNLFLFLVSTLLLAGSITAQPTLFTNVNIFDGTTDRLITGQDVLVEDNLIARIGPGLTAPEGATVIDGGGRTLMPGLIDSHVHFNLMVPGGPPGLEAATWEEIGAMATIRLVSGYLTGLQRPGIWEVCTRGCVK